MSARSKKGRVARRNRWLRAEATREVLVERFPRTFMPKGERKIPLKVGIYQDLRIAAPDLSARKMADALHDYTTGRTYLRALVAGAHRIDLDGWPEGVVTTEEAVIAAQTLRDIDARNSPREAPHAASVA
ncbi:ProQ/FINO family protein [Ancylobacter radicis]|uniref:ProQ/FinO family protein n=1 Tax=Ancylobacter radicis TaxID=2836179 RepID=A0ABS5R3Z6_9HYPH|nr:ProQ/FinO family protein [Ancylobacter radicis]MBS9476197.1 ProQ/FinO family protein [Ancylobacter radicis]